MFALLCLINSTNIANLFLLQIKQNLLVILSRETVLISALSHLHRNPFLARVLPV